MNSKDEKGHDFPNENHLRAKQNNSSLDFGLIGEITIEANKSPKYYLLLYKKVMNYVQSAYSVTYYIKYDLCSSPLHNVQSLLGTSFQLLID